MTLAVTTYFWSDPTRNKIRNYEFTHEHVRILKRMVARHLTIPHRFLCVSDDDIDGVDTVPLLWDKHVPGTCFIRLQQRHPDYGRMVGASRVLNLDIDVVIVGNIDSIVDREEENVWYINPNFPNPRRAPYQTSIQLFTPGTLTELYTEFDPETRMVPGKNKDVNWRFGGAEQAWVSEMLPWPSSRPPNTGFWTSKDGIYGAGRLGGRGIGTELPDNAKIITLPGNRMMDQPEVQEKHPWIKEHWK